MKMGKKRLNGSLGKSLMKDRFSGKRRTKGDSFLHTSELNDGYEWGRLNLQSVTEMSNLNEFLATATLAGTEFEAEKLRVEFVSGEKYTGLLTMDEERNVLASHEQHKDCLRIPRRPHWDKETSTDELLKCERESFLDWRRQLSKLQEVEGLIMTPYEKNLEFWRQLWRVIERSDIVAQIVDARNPLLFRCEDLEKYVNEVSENKVNMILINKADFLTQKQREFWAEYFDSLGLRVAFFSAVNESSRNGETKEASSENSDGENDSEETEEEDEEEEESEDSEDSDSMKEDDDVIDTTHKSPDDNDQDKGKDVNMSGDNAESKLSSKESQDKISNTNVGMESSDTEKCGDKTSAFTENSSVAKSSPRLLTCEELIDLWKSLCSGKGCVMPGVVTAGLVGYPNVGKSSTINAILQTKKVPVSATPGRTKHFQTLFVDETLMLCDCPGLVMPMFVSTKAEMVTGGILPVDQIRDFVPPVSLVCRHIPRLVLEKTYSILLPIPAEGEDPNRTPTCYELLAAYASMRGFMTHKGIPDFQRAARIILKDYVKGKLLYSRPPPGVSEDDFESVGGVFEARSIGSNQTTATSSQSFSTQKQQPQLSDLDKNFFARVAPQVASKGVRGVAGFTRVSNNTEHVSTTGSTTGSSAGSMDRVNDKPGKKHNNRHKKEKIRRLKGHLDQ